MFYMPVKLHIRHHDNSFNERYLQVNVFGEDKKEAEYLYFKVTTFLVNASDNLKKNGIYPEEIYRILMKDIAKKFAFDSFVTDNNSILKFDLIDCVISNFQIELNKFDKSN